MRITLRRQGPLARMQVRGDFDLFLREPFLEQVEQLTDQGVRELHVDLRGVHFLGSTGVTALLRARRLLRALDGELHVDATSHECRESLEQLGLDGLLLGRPRRAG